MITAAMAVFALFLCRLYANVAQDARCEDIVSIDFKNLRVDIPMRGIVQLENGIAFSSDAGEDDESKDWEIRLVRDEILRPEAGKALRLIKLNANHLIGSGAWDHVFIFSCVEGQIVRLFHERFLYGVHIEKITDAELIFISGEWMNKDPMCCPSKERISTYRWSTEENTFIEVNSVFRPRQESHSSH
jgi:hypothetical protein